MKIKSIIITVTIFILCTAGIIVFSILTSSQWPFIAKKPHEQHMTRVIIPEAVNEGEYPSWLDNPSSDDINSLRAPLGEGEFVISVLNYDFDYDGIEEQIVVFRSITDSVNRVSITLFSYDVRNRTYKRMWSYPIIASMPGTISMYSLDLLGDRSNCIIVTGMNDQNNHTMTIFNRNPQEDLIHPFTTIAEIQMDGSITVQETERPLAYRQGISRGQPYTIAAYGRDPASSNLMDRLEIIYSFNSTTGFYQQSRVTRIPGSQIEQRRVREILSGDRRVFEEFLNDLWYYVSPQGTIDRSQYLYFDPLAREIIFFGDEAQQVFYWQNSNPTRFGLYVSSFNRSITTMRRFMNIELETLDRIGLRVIDDARLKIRVSNPWDGSYRRAANTLRTESSDIPVNHYTESTYDSSMGRIRFFLNGEYELVSSENFTKGRYVFFKVSGTDLLELRPDNASGNNRQIYHITNAGAVSSVGAFDNKDALPDTIILTRVRLGSAGIQELHEGQIIFTRAR